jgi:hypothetical protein
MESMVSEPSEILYKMLDDEDMRYASKVSTSLELLDYRAEKSYLGHLKLNSGLVMQEIQL